MSDNRWLLILLVLTLITFCCRALPFVLFDKKGGVPAKVLALGQILPYSLIATLAIYTLSPYLTADYKKTVITLICVGWTVFIHVKKRNFLLSIASATLLYMLLMQFFLLQ